MSHARCGRCACCPSKGDIRVGTERKGGGADALLLETRAQATVEYAIVTVAVLSMVLALGVLWHAGEGGALVRDAEQSASHALNAYGALDIALF